MTTTMTSPAQTRRPAAVSTTVGVLIFLGISAVAGGVMLSTTTGPAEWFPADWLDRLPLIDSWLIPGLVLGIGFGVGSLAAAYGVLRRPAWPWLGTIERLTGHRWPWIATILLGAGQVVWILLELVYLGFSWLHVVYGSVGLALVLLPLSQPVRRYLAIGGAHGL